MNSPLLLTAADGADEADGVDVVLLEHQEQRAPETSTQPLRSSFSLSGNSFYLALPKASNSSGTRVLDIAVNPIVNHLAEAKHLLVRNLEAKGRKRFDISIGNDTLVSSHKSNWQQCNS